MGERVSPPFWRRPWYAPLCELGAGPSALWRAAGLDLRFGEGHHGATVAQTRRAPAWLLWDRNCCGVPGKLSRRATEHEVGIPALAILSRLCLNCNCRDWSYGIRPAKFGCRVPALVCLDCACVWQSPASLSRTQGERFLLLREILATKRFCLCERLNSCDLMAL